MPVDGLSAGLRALSFVALFQATGAAIFLACFGGVLLETRRATQRLASVWALVAIGLLILQYLLEAARMGGDLASVMDGELQALALHSSAARALALRVVGLVVLALALRTQGKPSTSLIVASTVVVFAGFTLMGHTSSHSPRWILAPLLLAHLIVVAFWFGALVPLRLASLHESAPTAGATIEAFSAAAAWIVPALFVAGLALAAVLLGGFAGLRTAYGQLLIAKVVGFALLIGLASLNKWRLGPAVAAGDGRLTRTFRRSLQIEYVLIAAVLTVTAVMTTFFSPD
ncbi:MAG: CopD family protein [Gammaproteobacteria bacterium]